MSDAIVPLALTRSDGPRIETLGDAAFVIHAEASSSGVTKACRVRAVAEAIATAAPRGVIDVVPLPDQVTVIYDPAFVDSPDRLATDVSRLAAAALESPSQFIGARHEIPVQYGGKAGPDIAEVCRSCGIDIDTFVRLHSEADYSVTAIGFVPGFAYLGGLHPSLFTPRRSTPRTSVPAGSIGIGGDQTGIYPFAIPGGWQIVGCTSASLFDPLRSRPALLRFGDRVRFIVKHTPAHDLTIGSDSIRPTSIAHHVGPGHEGKADLTIVEGGLSSSVQDLGRPGHRAAGVPLSGAADRESLIVANLIVGNAADAAAIECTLLGPTIRFESDCIVALGGADFPGLQRWRPVRMPAGTTLALGHATGGCRGYLAVAGGIDVPMVLGSRSTYSAGHFGGFLGRPLTAGDQLQLLPGSEHVREHWSLSPRILPLPEKPCRLRFLPAAGVTDAWGGGELRTEFRVSARSDRMGLRLVGPLLEAGGGGGPSVAVLPGTVQLPPDGHPIVLLADAQTMGGYPVLGQVIMADLRLAAQLRPGDAVRFEPTTLAAAHAAWKNRITSLGRIRHSLGSCLPSRQLDRGVVLKMAADDGATTAAGEPP